MILVPYLRTRYPVPVDSSGGAAGRPVTSSAAKVSHAASHQSNLSLASMTMHKGMLVTELLSERKLLQNLSRHVICRAVTCLDRQWQNSGGSQTDDSVWGASDIYKL
ncbi:unnamed protein product [Fusarium venenatum]|uniref:Uncharacterized protein n=1 Tax=Fusarium venenatum TaxID=56646 RepID=A0A2L2T680_9HYPO|nr:uncharacterized protein FVRRES_01880 [Fusarium venenatum]CEI65368.1 unnamed protein product [Fusarium venenatum]